MACPGPVFSATLRMLSVGSNEGGSFSSSSVTEMVTSMEALAPSLSSATTVTE